MIILVQKGKKGLSKYKCQNMQYIYTPNPEPCWHCLQPMVNTIIINVYSLIIDNKNSMTV